MKAQFNGVDGKMELYDDKIIIRKKFSFGGALGGGQETQILLSQVDGIEYAKSSLLMNVRGHLAILAAGYKAYPMPKKNTKDDPRLSAKNIITYWYTSNKKAEEFKQLLEQSLQNVRSVDVQTVAKSVTDSALSEADEIAKFKALLDSGAISQDEYDAKKKQLLGI